MAQNLAQNLVKLGENGQKQPKSPLFSPNPHFLFGENWGKSPKISRFCLGIIRDFW
nr:MAG TPA: hypothetical protein [Caudoviricetes sp.]